LRPLLRIEARVPEGAEPIGDSPEQFSATLKLEYDNWGKVVKEAAIRVE
jgi:hypothetical protein